MELKTLEKLLNTHFSIIAIETQDFSSLYDAFRQYNNVSQTPIYVWNKNTGLCKKSLPEVKIPQTTTAIQALNFIGNNSQNSIFILNDFAIYLDDTFIEKALLNLSPQQNNKIIIIDQKIDLTEKFNGLALETKKLFKMKLRRAA